MRRFGPHPFFWRVVRGSSSLGFEGFLKLPHHNGKLFKLADSDPFHIILAQFEELFAVEHPVSGEPARAVSQMVEKFSSQPCVIRVLFR